MATIKRQLVNEAKQFFSKEQGHNTHVIAERIFQKYSGTLSHSEILSLFHQALRECGLTMPRRRYQKTDDSQTKIDDFLSGNDAYITI